MYLWKPESSSLLLHASDKTRNLSAHHAPCERASGLIQRGEPYPRRVADFIQLVAQLRVPILVDRLRAQQGETSRPTEPKCKRNVATVGDTRLGELERVLYHITYVRHQPFASEGPKALTP